MRRWTVTEIAEIGRHHCAVSAAIALGRTPRAVQDMARRAAVSVPRMPHACYRPGVMRRRVIRLRGQGYSIRQISTSTGIPFGTVRRWVYERKDHASE